MNKKEALKILIENTDLFSEEVREKLIFAIPDMSDEDIDDLGLMLAHIKESDQKEYEQHIKMIDEMLTKLETLE